jgi:hypothetical protein
MQQNLSEAQEILIIQQDASACPFKMYIENNA